MQNDIETLHINFPQLFESGRTQIARVLIPKIQRAYAQGRLDTRSSRTRAKFLDAIYDSVSSGRPLTLDFVYGKNDAGTLIPLDGQQRLTTLFLLYWYASRLAGGESECGFLRHFSYETRYSARDFIDRLIDFWPDMSLPLSAQIQDEAWFPLDWRYDPTVEGMLVMLDAIQRKFSGIDNLLEALGNVRFYFLPIEQMGLTDDIYIKMNSRGKPLTDFEHFKAEFEKALKGIDEGIASRIARKIDVDWTDFLWAYRGEDNIIDDEFLRYFRFVCDILCYKAGQSPKQADEFELIKLYFTGEHAKENVLMLERYFDCWLDCDVEYTFNLFISEGGHEKGKITLFHNYSHNFLKDCLWNYAEVIGGRNRKFTLNQIIILYAFTLYRLNKDKITASDFSRRLRIVYNLVNNSSDEISDSEARIGGNRMPAILKQVDSIILHGVIAKEIRLADDENPRPNFNVNQLEEEMEKLVFTEANPQLSESLFRLEDHKILQGRISAVGVEHPEWFGRFERLFDCSWDLVDCAMLASGDYYRRDNQWRIQMGSYNDNSKSWRELFDPSSKALGFDGAKSVLAMLLSREEISDAALSQIKDDYIKKCEDEGRYPWKYYYLKYESFRPGRYGKYSQREEEPYVMEAIWAPKYESSNSYQVFLNEIGEVDRNYNGWRITLNNGGDYFRCANDAYLVMDKEDNILQRHEIPQDDGIDAVERIEYGRRVFAALSLQS